MISKTTLALAPLALSLFACTAPTAPSEEVATSVSSALTAPTSPSATLDVPAGNHLKFKREAVGVQTYVCTASPTATYSWVLYGPQANLRNDDGKLRGTHFAGPKWQSNDGSLVGGTKLKAFTVDPTAVAWLLLAGSSHSGDPGQMSDVSFIQRFNTTGGLAPATGCDSTHGGAIASIPYTATYYFYAPGAGGRDDD